MAELGLIVNILAKVDKALSEIDKIKNKMTKMGSEGTKQTDRATLSAKRMGASLALVGMIAGKAFKSIVDASPSMQVAFIMMGVEAENAWRAIGENLAPVIEDILSPAVRSLSEFIQALDPEIQTWIGATIGITVVIGLLAVAVIALGYVSLPLVATIFLLGAAIAFVILASKGYLDGLTDETGEFSDALEVLIGIGKAIGWVFKLSFDMFMGVVSGMWEGLKTVVQGIGQTIMGIVDFFVEAFGFIVAFIKGDDAGMEKALEGMLTGIKKFAAGIANIVIGIVKFVVLQIMNIAKAVTDALGIDTPKLDAAIENVKDWGIDTSSYHEGGTVVGPRDVMAWLKPKERVRTETQESALQRELANGGRRNDRPSKITLIINYPSFNERGDMDRLASVVERRLTQSQYQRGYS